MNKQQQETIKAQPKNLNSMWWGVTLLLITIGVFANYYFSSLAWAIRLAGMLVIGCLAIIAALQTNSGKKFFTFAKEARVELNKVFWPTRQETIKTTAVIAILVIAMSLVMWGIDSLLLWIINWLMGR